MFGRWKCKDCGHIQSHPVIVRSNPRCDACYGGRMERVECPTEKQDK